MHNKNWQRALTLALAAAGYGGVSAGASAGASVELSLPAPQHIAIDTAPARADTDVRVLAARRYAAFWNTGDAQFARQALSPSFIDRTLPAGRPQGVDGPLQASEGFRKAVPDLNAEVQDMTVAGDRVAVHLRFRGHFTGVFGQLQGKGQAVDFQAHDLYRIQDGRIAENWHLEDNLTLMQQLGAIPQ
ncbi:ester cyclase [Herbaspirillum hiltneri N3]|uniref:Ester cyclase n=1 Tax=Herbaspirillum hiltneri N3 TaxID=1262470 RepID=A0ABN4HU56_9BURK|nr:ester cyclase [Herbaspirillum hiltneri]AKZ62154.1 ester cyclase [Herbaspirillum hiltneri N3]